MKLACNSKCLLVSVHRQPVDVDSPIFRSNLIWNQPKRCLCENVSGTGLELNRFPSLLALFPYSGHFLFVLQDIFFRDSSVAFQETLSQEPIQYKLLIVSTRRSFRLVLIKVSTLLPYIVPVKCNL